MLLPLMNFGVLSRNTEGAPTSVALPVHVPPLLPEPEPVPEPEPEPPSGWMTFDASTGLPSLPPWPPVPTASPLPEQLARYAALAAARHANAQNSRRDASTSRAARLIDTHQTAIAADLSLSGILLTVTTLL